jgi:hypothetical protein
MGEFKNSGQERPLHTNNSGQQLGGVFGVVGQDDAGAGAADAE